MIHIKRFFIIGLLVTVLFVVQNTSADSLWLPQISNDAILDSIALIQQRNNQIQQLVNEEMEIDPNEQYNQLFENNNHHSFHIYFSQTEFDQLQTDLETTYQTQHNYQLNTYYNVDVYYQDDYRTELLRDVGFKMAGGVDERRFILDDEQHLQDIHFQLKFNETFQTVLTSETYKRLKTREFADTEELIFRYNSIDDPTNTVELFGYEAMRSAGVIVPHVSYSEIHMYVEDELKHSSLYTIIEQFDEEFIRKHFVDSDVGNLYEAGYSATLEPITDGTQIGIADELGLFTPLYERKTNEDNQDDSTLIDFSIQLNQLPDTVLQTYLEQHFDVDSFLKMSAMHVILGNVDDYRSNGNNIYYYVDPDGYITILPYNYTNIMGYGYTGEPTFINNTLGNDIYQWGTYSWTNFTTPLWDNIIQFETYQLQYEEYLQTYINTVFTEDAFLKEYFQAKNLYGDAFSFALGDISFITNKQWILREQLAYYNQLRTSE